MKESCNVSEFLQISDIYFAIAPIYISANFGNILRYNVYLEKGIFNIVSKACKSLVKYNVQNKKMD